MADLKVLAEQAVTPPAELLDSVASLELQLERAKEHVKLLEETLEIRKRLQEEREWAAAVAHYHASNR